MPTITIQFLKQLLQTKDVELPSYVTYNGSYYKIISEDVLIQVTPEIDGGEIVVKKWKNKTSVTRILSDSLYEACTSADFNTAYQSAIASLNDLNN